ncbi:hypothetical protein MJ585_22570 [Klebsiella pneumoniae]|nr:hypothetical protein MJ585_22570 [Klebsiella pneumoniae]
MGGAEAGGGHSWRALPPLGFCTTRPLAILDLGARSTDASIINARGEISALTW